MARGLRNTISIVLVCLILMAGSPVLSAHQASQACYTTQQGGENSTQSMPSKYDPRETGMVSAVKAQGKYSTCWAFAGIATLESFLIKHGFEDNSVNLSEQHLIWWSRRDASGFGWNRGAVNGGFGVTITGYFSSANAPICNKDMEYKPDMGISVPQDFYKHKRLYRVTDIEYLKDDRDKIKSAIYNDGAVCTHIYQDFDDLHSRHKKYYGSNNFSYFYPCRNGCVLNHQVAVVGWDDNYSKQNFNEKNRPKNDGAWLVKNSTGPEFYDKGFMWVSYEDGVMFKNINNFNITFCIRGVEKEEDTKVYQADEYGAVSNYFLTNEKGVPYKKLTAMNVYDFDKEYNKLDSIMINTACSGAEYKIYYAYMNKKEPVLDDVKLVLLSQGIIEYDGYMTCKLDTPFILPEGKGAILVEIDSTMTETMPNIGCDVDCIVLKSGIPELLFKSNSKKDISYVLHEGKFINAKLFGINSPVDYNLVNLSIKAVTKR